MLTCCHEKNSSPWRTALWLLFLFTGVNIIYLCTSFDLHHWTLQYFSARNETLHAFHSSSEEEPNQLFTRYPVAPLGRETALQKSSFPFPIENITYELAAAPSTVNACKSGLRTLFLVHTAPSHFHHRNTLRERLGATYNNTLVFLTGLTSDYTLTRNISAEAKQHGDVVILPYVDAYRNLTYKFVYGIKWTIENCPGAKHVVKIDDDIVVNVYRLDAYLNDTFSKRTGDFHCLTWHNMGVIRDPNSPWYLSKELYPKNRFPAYCSGSAMFLPVSKLDALYNASFSVPFIPVDDAYVTGELAKLAKVGHVEINREYTLNGMPQRVAKGEVMFAHFYNDKEREVAWKNMVPPTTQVRVV
ncbi:beta-1,3-galactosyltransferase 1-like [Ornithodoros turicata]|uniref:beta-1,3-galactosyltransferase 1-like n=1 Tax=Ornithodoros turicata TaxID=34597 RepID=UPI003139A84B